MKRIILLITLLFCLTISSYDISLTANPQQQEIRELGKVLKSKEVLTPDPTSGLNRAGVWDRIIVIKVELLQKSSGEKQVVKTVLGYLTPNTGDRVNEFDNKTQLLLQRQYGGYFSKDEY